MKQKTISSQTLYESLQDNQTGLELYLFRSNFDWEELILLGLSKTSPKVVRRGFPKLLSSQLTKSKVDLLAKVESTHLTFTLSKADNSPFGELSLKLNLDDLGCAGIIMAESMDTIFIRVQGVGESQNSSFCLVLKFLVPRSQVFNGMVYVLKNTFDSFDLSWAMQCHIEELIEKMG